jgi:TolB-like protein
MRRRTLNAVVTTILTLSSTAAFAAAPARVLLLPFESAGEAERAWVAKAVQQNLLAELSRVNSVQVVTGDTSPKDQDAALKAAQDAKADYIVFGSYQAVEGDLRITGQVLDANKKEAVAGLKATGSVRDLFGMEDVIAHQVKRALPQPVADANKPEMLRQPPAAPPPGIEPNGPVAVDVNQRARELEDAIDQTIDRLRYAAPYEYAYPTYSSFYSTPYYYYPVYYYYPFHRHHVIHHGSGISGSFTGHNFSGSFSVGNGGIGYPRPAGGNYANFGRMTMQPVRR